MNIENVVWIVLAILVGLALVEVALKYFRADKIAKRERKKWEHLVFVRKRESETLAHALGVSQRKVKKLLGENKVLADNASSYALKLTQALQDRDSYKELYEKEARKKAQSNSMGDRAPVDDSMRLSNFFVFDHKPSRKEVKERYKRLSSIYHPDKEGGDIETMQEINTQYQKTLKYAA